MRSNRKEFSQDEIYLVENGWRMMPGPYDEILWEKGGVTLAFEDALEMDDMDQAADKLADHYAEN